MGQFQPSDQLSNLICGTRSVSMLVAPDGSSDLSAVFASFSPRDNRLAVVYHGGTAPRDKWRTVIDIWDIGWNDVQYGFNPMQRLTSFSIRGYVGYRIGWSQDARRLAAVRSINDRNDALIYALP
jgi:hypothetical protein